MEYKHFFEDVLLEQRVSALFEKNTPTSPDKWAKAKAAARAKFDVYPSAYANLWAAKKYKSMGGGWKRKKKNEEFTLESQASDDAKRQGLEYYGFGRYGKDGKTTHHVVDGKLQPVKGSDTKTPTKPSATKKQAVKKPLTKLPSFKQFKDSMAGAGHSATKQEWHRELDRVVVSAYEKQNPPTKLPPEAVSTTEEEKQDFESRLKKLGLGDVAAPPRTSSGIVNPKFMKVMIDHQKQFPYSREIWNRFGGAGGENPTWMPKVHTNE